MKLGKWLETHNHSRWQEDREQADSLDSEASRWWSRHERSGPQNYFEDRIVRFLGRGDWWNKARDKEWWSAQEVEFVNSTVDSLRAARFTWHSEGSWGLLLRTPLA